MSEVIYQLRGYADMIVGSEETSWEDAEEYSSLFNHLAANYPARGVELHVEDVSQEIINNYKPINNGNHTISSLWVGRTISTLIPAINNLAQELINLVNEGHGNEIKDIITVTQHMNVPIRNGEFFNHSYRDLYSFSKLLINRFGSNSKVGEAARDVMNAIEQVVEQEKHNNGDYHGISIFLPDDRRWYYNSTWGTSATYRATDFAQYTEWDNFLKALFPSQG